MPATTHLTNLHDSILKHLDAPNAVSPATLQQWLSELNAFSQALESIQPAIQQVVDVTDALALTGQLLGTDHPTALDADVACSSRCANGWSGQASGFVRCFEHELWIGDLKQRLDEGP
jgi:hypothetical protein